MKLSTTRKAGLLAVMAVVAVSFDSCNSGGTGTNTWSIQGITGPTITYNTNMVTISAVFQNLQMTGGGTIPIPHLPGSSIEIAPDVSGGTLLQLQFSAADILAMAKANLLDPNSLPDGRPLPGVQGGLLPSLAVQVPSLDNITFYFGASVFGAFIPINLGFQQIIGTFNYYDSSNKLIGQLSIVGSDTAGKDSGILLLLNLSAVGVQMAERGMLEL